MAFCEEGNHRPYLKSILFDEPTGWLVDCPTVPLYEGRLTVECAICGLQVTAPFPPGTPSDMGTAILTGVASCTERLTLDHEKRMEIMRREHDEKKPAEENSRQTKDEKRIDAAERRAKALHQVP